MSSECLMIVDDSFLNKILETQNPILFQYKGQDPLKIEGEKLIGLKKAINYFKILQINDVSINQ